MWLGSSTNIRTRRPGSKKPHMSIPKCRQIRPARTHAHAQRTTLKAGSTRRWWRLARDRGSRDQPTPKRRLCEPDDRA